MLEISQDFLCGNIQVLSVDGDEITVEPEIRANSPYFYWMFRVTGAEGRTVHFKFPTKTRVGYPGAAVSPDAVHWHWSGNRTEDEVGEGFVYTFGKDEHCTYFAHNMVYTPERLALLLQELGLQTEVFCHSRKGREVPCISVGTGDTVLFTSRAHACESTGTYLLEGILRAAVKNPVKGFRLLFVPFVDYDGVVDGDAGKSREPHDHNRDYGDFSPYHPEVAAIKALAESGSLFTNCDFHSPHHCGDVNDHPYLMTCENSDRDKAFNRALANACKRCPEAYQYDGLWDIPYNALYNEGYKPNMKNYMRKHTQLQFSFLMETAYFGTDDNRFTQEGCVKLGECFWEAFRPVLVHRELSERIYQGITDQEKRRLS